jgi:hypothetical protein
MDRTEVAMTNLPVPTEIDKTVALDWLRHSLGQGEVISPAALEFIVEHEGHAYTLAPATVDPAVLATPSSGGVTKTSRAREGLAKVLDGLTERDAACVVVENDLRLKRDPAANLDRMLMTGFIGEKVIHWANLADGAADAVAAVHRGASGYPANAFVTSASAQELGLVDGADLDHDIAGPVVGSLMAVIVAAYDAETFMIWEPTA